MRSIRSLLFALLITQIVGFGNTLGVELVTNLSEFGDGIFNFKESKEFVEIPEVTFPELNIFCYNGKFILLLLKVAKFQSLISFLKYIFSFAQKVEHRLSLELLHGQFTFSFLRA